MNNINTKRTNKQYFQEKLSKYGNVTPSYILNNEHLHVIGSYEDEQYIGFECMSKKTSICCKACHCVIDRIKDTRGGFPLYGMINNKSVILKLQKNYSIAKRASKVLPNNQLIKTHMHKKRRNIFQ